MRIATSALFAAALAALPMTAANAQYYYPCHPFPLTWPFCIAGAAVGTAATIATAPFRAAAYPYYSGYPYYNYYGQPYYYGAGYYYPRRAYRRHHHRYYYR